MIKGPNTGASSGSLKELTQSNRGVQHSLTRAPDKYPAQGALGLFRKVILHLSLDLAKDHRIEEDLQAQKRPFGRCRNNPADDRQVNRSRDVMCVFGTVDAAAQDDFLASLRNDTQR